MKAAEENGLIQKIEQRLQNFKQLLRNNRVNQGNLRMWTYHLRGYVTEIYGKDSELLKYLPPIRENLRPEDVAKIAAILTERAESFIGYLNEAGGLAFAPHKAGKVFIGHGRSLLWRELKYFLSERLGLGWDEFNREAVAGVITIKRLLQMLSEASFAFLIMTAEDQHSDQSLHARENVVHEVGLFQGRLGPNRAIILLEDGCKEFSNIVGLSVIPFPKGHISGTFEKIRMVLEREAIT